MTSAERTTGATGASHKMDAISKWSFEVLEPIGLMANGADGAG